MLLRKLDQKLQPKNLKKTNQNLQPTIYEKSTLFSFTYFQHCKL